MPIRTTDKGAGTRHARRPEKAARLADRRLQLPALAMATASRLYTAAGRSDALPELTAKALANEPGQMCLVSLVSGGGEGLRPVAVSHRRANASRYLRSVIVQQRDAPPDAFSKAVLRSGGALRMAISRPDQLRLWLPPVYWPYVERVAVNGVLAAALTGRSRAFGALLLWREGDQPPFDESDETYLVILATRLALGLADHPLVRSTPGAAYT